jgi:hypothetical protein
MPNPDMVEGLMIRIAYTESELRPTSDGKGRVKHMVTKTRCVDRLKLRRKLGPEAWRRLMDHEKVTYKGEPIELA